MNKNILDMNEALNGTTLEERFSSVSQCWFNVYEKRVKDTTALNVKYMINKHFNQYVSFSDKLISNVSVADIHQFIYQKIEEGYSKATINKLLQILSKIFDFAVRFNMTKNNPVRKIRTFPSEPKKISTWTIEEIRVFLNESKDKPYYITFLLAIYTGMRKAELLGLTWNDIDFENKHINVRRTLTGKSEQGLTYSYHLKRRQIQIPNIVLEELLAHKKQQEDTKMRSGKDYKDQGLVNCTKTGDVLAPSHLSIVMKKICEASNVTKLRFHEIRYTHASILLTQGADPSSVAYRIGSKPFTSLIDFLPSFLSIQNNLGNIFYDAVQTTQI